MPTQELCKIVYKDSPNSSAVRMELEVGRMVEKTYRAPGQFVHIKCGEEHFLRRPISVCSCQSDEPEDLLTIVFEARGAGTEWLARREVGERLDVLGLLGNGFQVEPTGRYLLVGGGIGVPPLLGCAELTARRSTAILGFRSADRAMLLPDFRSVCADVQIATDDGTQGYHGFVDALVRKALEQDRDYTGILACGPKPMLRAVVRAAAGFDVPVQVSMEERMACGVGACLACATPMADGTMKHVCKDGPVFDALEVDWNA